MSKESCISIFLYFLLKNTILMSELNRMVEHSESVAGGNLSSCCPKMRKIGAQTVSVPTDYRHGVTGGR